MRPPPTHPPVHGPVRHTWLSAPDACHTPHALPIPFLSLLLPALHLRLSLQEGDDVWEAEVQTPFEGVVVDFVIKFYDHYDNNNKKVRGVACGRCVRVSRL